MRDNKDWRFVMKAYKEMTREELLTLKVPTKDNANRTLLEKHLSDYTAKNSFDYFISNISLE